MSVNRICLLAVTTVILSCEPTLSNPRLKEVQEFFEEQKKIAKKNVNWTWKEEFGKWRDDAYKNYLALRQHQINFDELAGSLDTDSAFTSRLEALTLNATDFRTYLEARQLLPQWQDKLVHLRSAAQGVTHNEKKIRQQLEAYDHQQFCAEHVAIGAAHSADSYFGYDRIDVSHIAKPRHYNMRGPIASDLSGAERAAGTLMTVTTVAGCVGGTVVPVVGNLVGCLIGGTVALIVGPLTSLFATLMANSAEEDRYYDALRRSFAHQDEEIAQATAWTQAHPILKAELIKFGAEYCATNESFSRQAREFSAELTAKAMRDMKTDNQERLQRVEYQVVKLEAFFDELYKKLKG